MQAKTIQQTRLGFLIALFTLCSLGGSSQADPLDTWTWRNPRPTGNYLVAIGYGNGRFVAAGGPNTIITSTNGAAWVLQPSRVSIESGAIVFGNGRFIAVDREGSILTSTDGASWTSAGQKTDSGSAIAYGNGRFVLLDGNGNGRTLTDGQQWVAHPTGLQTTGVSSIAYGSGQFVAVGVYGAAAPKPTILTSADGVDWVERQIAPTNVLNAVTYGGGQFVAVGEVGVIMTSNDGAHWVNRSSGVTSSLRGATYGNGRFVVVSPGSILWSADGTNWVPSLLPAVGWLTSVAWGSGQFAAVGGQGTILTSVEAERWISRQSGPQNILLGVAYGNRRYFAVGQTGTILTSGDGSNWVERRSGTTNDLLSVTYGNGLFAAVGSYGGTGEPESRIVTSADGETWVRSSAPQDLYGICYAADQFVAVGNTILTSANGKEWIARTSDTTLWLRHIAYGNGVFVALNDRGASRAILTSTDGANWEMHPWHNFVGAGASSLAYGHGCFAMTYWDDLDTGRILSSKDGLNWKSVVQGVRMDAVAYGHGQFVAVGRGGAILRSADGLNWGAQSFGVIYSQCRAIGYGDSSFVAVGAGGAILQSDSIVTLSLAAGSSNGGTSISVEGPLGVDYELQSSTNLTNWKALLPIRGDPSGKTTVVLPSPGAGSLFYRTFQP